MYKSQDMELRKQPKIPSVGGRIDKESAIHIQYCKIEYCSVIKKE